jgi:hypothetical protein
VLSTPPAFILSQDQTLQQKPVKEKPQQKHTPKHRGACQNPKQRPKQ